MHPLDRREDDTEVRAARSKIARVSWAADQPRQQGPKGLWEVCESRNVAEREGLLYDPIYFCAEWRARVLADLGPSSTTRGIRRVGHRVFMLVARKPETRRVEYLAAGQWRGKSSPVGRVGRPELGRRRAR